VGAPLSLRERRAQDQQNFEGAVSAVVDIGMTVFNARFDGCGHKVASTG
jgi:hypothetical protein